MTDGTRGGGPPGGAALCHRPDCPAAGHGRINDRGFCSECGHKAQGPAPGAASPGAPASASGTPEASGILESESTATAARARRRAVAGKFTVRPAGDGLMDLPRVELPSLRDLIDNDPQPPPKGQPCAGQGCEETVGAAYAGQPALWAGFCPRPDCRHPFDFTPKLRPGDLLGGQYEVVGCVAYGGLGWVYLAEDTQLDRQPVAIKGLINDDDETAQRAAVEERRYLTLLDHQGILRIINYVPHPDRDSGRLRGYIVMEFVAGMTLAGIRDRIKRSEPPFDDSRLYQYILTYGAHILDALEYLHGEKLVYCDIKPSNVMHHEGRVKVIDLGAVRRLGQRDGPVTYTDWFASPEVRERGAADLTELHDLYGVGRTLLNLSDKAVRADQRPPGLGAESYRRLLDRATAFDPRRRFRSAREMAEQLRGVLRELHSLRLEREQPEPSTLFSPTAALLDSGLGRIPGLERWLAGEARPVLADGRPDPAEVPFGLPVPFPDAKDPGAALLNTPTGSGPRRLIEQLGAFPHESAEIRFRICRAHLELGEPADAEAQLRAVERIIGGGAPYDWRLNWHRALVRLTEGAVAEARQEFDAVYDALPGEYAPKLALGYCAEHLRDHGAAEQFYQAVWQRNRSQGSAAFGLARLRLAAGDRTGAVDVLGGVPKVSRHHDAAQIATVRALAGRLGHPDRLPTETDFAEALTRLPRLYLDDGRASGHARERLTAEVLEVALDWVLRYGAADDAREAGALFGERDEQSAVRARLEKALRALAQQADSPEALEVLVDRANAVRPMTRV
ncbi:MULTISPECIES: serine/threonine-protein kinase [Streptomyces]|uniref:non-specific serine/threonine protein kinase n=1 Tax=Streptomyces lonegramiae TaxID=3075524 RepID=A0ABU2XW01_9ACTN|nr:tetratricopeptide repeat protein [Streptomyces sp. DSM 41529]MDT0549677.1 tetratricopeptide repeat protein [Streptomyces sp. DSM 41529]